MKAFGKILASLLAGSILLASAVSCSSKSFDEPIFKKTALRTSVGRTPGIPLSDAVKSMSDLVITSEDEDVAEVVQKSTGYKLKAKSTGVTIVTATTSGTSADLEVIVGVSARFSDLDVQEKKYYPDDNMIIVPADAEYDTYKCVTGSKEIIVSKANGHINGYIVEAGISDSELVFEPYTVSPEDKFTVTFIVNSSIVATQTVDAYQKVQQPDTPVGTGNFVGWYEKNGNVYGSSAFNFDTKINRNITLYARFESSEIKVSSITVSGDSIVLLNGTSNYTASVMPSNALDKTVTWSVENGTGSATINQNGVLTATGAGTVTVKATANDGSNVSGSASVEITNGVVLSSIELKLSGAAVNAGSNVSAIVTAKYSDGTSKVVTSSSTVSCDDDTAAVSGSTIKGVKKGTATIDASYSEGGITKTDSKTLTVNETTPAPAPAFDGIKILVAKSLGFDHIHYWDASDSSKYKNTTWPGVALDEDGDDYVKLFEGCSSVSLLITKSSGEKLREQDVVITSKGTYRITSSGAAKEETPVAPTVTITPNSETVYLTSKINVRIEANNSTLTTTSATINGKKALLNGAGSTSFTVQDYVTTVGTTFTVTVSATNGVGTGSANKSYTVIEKPVFDNSLDWNSLSIYQVMVSSFQDGDPSIGYTNAYGPTTTYNYATDSSEKTITGGDLQGIINAADYIADLGVNAIWMTPIFDSSSGENNEYLNSTGYFCYDYFKVDPKFGTNEKFAELVETYHNKGIYVILDGVFGHWNGAGVKASPTGKTAVRKNGQNKACAYPESLEFFKEVAQYWIKNYKIDGWRFDQCYQVGNGDKSVGDNSYTNDHNYWYEIRTAIAEAAAENASSGEQWGILGYTVGEHWNGDAATIQRGSVAPGENGAGYGLQSCFDFPSRYRLVQTMAREEGSNTATDFGAAMEYTYSDFTQKGYTHPDGYYPNLFFTNHDLVRYGNLLNWKFKIDPTSDEYFARHKLMLSVLAGYSGPITTYYGDEWGAYVKGYDSDGSLGAHNDNMARSNGKISGFTAKEEDLIEYFKKLMKARNSHKSMWAGAAETVSSTDSSYVVKKTYGGETIYICFNNGTSATTFNASGKDLITGQTYSGTVTVPALSSVFVLAN